jgi:hypothetical protein
MLMQFWRTSKRGQGTADATEDEAGTDSGSRKADILWISVESLKKQLRMKLGLAEPPTESTDDEIHARERIHARWRRCSQLQETYTAVRMHERQKMEKEFAAFFSRCDDFKVDIAPLVEALRRERRICESGRTLSDSLYFVELLERRLTAPDPEISKVTTEDQALRESSKKGAGDVRKCLIELFGTKCRSVRDLAARLDTIHRLAPAFCACLHEATISSDGSTRPPEEWEEFFLEPDRLAAEHTTNTGRDAEQLAQTARQHQWIFSLERAFQVERATTSSGVIKAMLDWPSDWPFEMKGHDKPGYTRLDFFAALRELPRSEQEGALPCLREAIFEELIPEGDFFEPWNYDDSERDRWFFRLGRFGDEHLAFLFGEQRAKEVIELAQRAREEFWRLNEHPRVSPVCCQNRRKVLCRLLPKD